jgi:phytol kinase
MAGPHPRHIGSIDAPSHPLPSTPSKPIRTHPRRRPSLLLGRNLFPNRRCDRGKNHLLFLIPILQLTVSDAIGALIGVRYGVHRFQTDDGQKSAEGSLAVFVAAFLATFLPLQLAGLHFEISLPISLLLALLLMLMEAIAWRGLDNLFLPLTCQVFLYHWLGIPARWLWHDLFWLVGVIVAIAIWRRRTHLSRSAGLGAGLVLYASGLLGGWPWLLGPLATLVGYSLLCFREREKESQHHLVHAIFAVATPGLLWLYLSAATQEPAFIYPYGLAYAANFGMIAAVFFLRKTHRRVMAAIIFATVLAFLLHAAPYLFVWRLRADLLELSLSAAGLLLLTIAVFTCWQPSIRNCPTDAPRWIRQGTLATAASVFGAGIILLSQP